MSAFIKHEAANGVVYFSSPLITAKHGFSTRIGGVSTLSHTASLNLAPNRGDPDDIVIENLKRFSEAVGVDEKKIISRPQVHSANVAYVTEENAGEGYFSKSLCDGDGYVTDRTGIVLGIKTADCVPILFEDPEARVIGAVHAGWRGTAAGIAVNCVKEMCAIGASLSTIRAAIGPAIHACCYEVGEDFRESVRELVGTAFTDRCITDRAGHLYADLIHLNRDLLLSCHLSPNHIDSSDLCTSCHPDLFYSHRFSRGIRGTMLSIIALG